MSQGRRSLLNNEEGRQSMRNAGIFTPEDIGLWIKEVLARNIQQRDLADKLGKFIESQYTKTSHNIKAMQCLISIESAHNQTSVQLSSQSYQRSNLL